MIMEICRAFDQNFKEHLDGVYVYVPLVFFCNTQCFLLDDFCHVS